ncbi:uncharacterized protein LOC142358462, partial [Convolutriloba macropyga]|uniref:uncharacterized protein LOC142358462 n=1 Tax=Convolutriloba macropyga TaxID=536237 RepID=UPI003F528FB9
EFAKPGYLGKLFCFWFKVDDCSSNKNFKCCVNYLKNQTENALVVYDFCYSRIGGGNSRELILINWCPKGEFKFRPRLVCEKLTVFKYMEAKSENDLQLHKVIEAASKGSNAYGMDTIFSY